MFQGQGDISPDMIHLSGSTCCTVLFNGRTLISSNAGDSRAVLVGMDNGTMFVKELTSDHKPCTQAEKDRILKAGGIIDTFKDENGKNIGPERVWAKGEDMPGLAMSRSMGDGLAHSVGVIATPEIIEYQVQDQDQFIVIGSDGVFEFLSN